VNFVLQFGGRVPSTRSPLGEQFCTVKQTHASLGCAKFHVQGENADFRPVSKFKYRLTWRPSRKYANKRRLNT